MVHRAWACLGASRTRHHELRMPNLNLSRYYYRKVASATLNGGPLLLGRLMVMVISIIIIVISMSLSMLAVKVVVVVH